MPSRVAFIDHSSLICSLSYEIIGGEETLLSGEVTSLWLVCRW